MRICREMLDKSLGRISSEESLCQEPSSSNGVALRALTQRLQSQRETVEPVSSSNVAGLPFSFASIYRAFPCGVAWISSTIFCRLSCAFAGQGMKSNRQHRERCGRAISFTQPTAVVKDEQITSSSVRIT